MTRLEREEKTVETMIRLYCDRHHVEARDGGKGLCADCAALLEYALKRVASCRFGAAKPACAKCRVHCYKPGMKETVREVMRWSGPRMLPRHPYLALTHLLDARRPSP